jgi:hypothetical protein
MERYNKLSEEGKLDLDDLVKLDKLASMWSKLYGKNFKPDSEEKLTEDEALRIYRENNGQA